MPLLHPRSPCALAFDNQTLVVSEPNTFNNQTLPVSEPNAFKKFVAGVVFLSFPSVMETNL